MRLTRRRHLKILAALFAPCVHAFYLPGSAPRDYRLGDNVDVLVNALTPGVETKLKSMINYDYYHPPFHFCQPEEGIRKQPESLGSILLGDRIFNSPFDINMLQNDSCRHLCTNKISPDDAKFINDKIREDYELNWLVDGLPAAEAKRDTRTDTVFYDSGFPLGTYDAEDSSSRPTLNNHYEIVMRYHSRSDNKHRIVGVLVWPMSYAPSSGDAPVCNSLGGGPLSLSESVDTVVPFTYSVTWNESTTPWATRYDHYLHIFDPRVHWFSLLSSIVIVVFLCGMVSTILYRSVSRDINRYNAIDLSEDVQEDFGWKLVWGEVFRPPQNIMGLSIAVGNGAQLTAMVCVTLLFALFGFLSPSNRGSMGTVLLICWTIFGFVAGYVSSRVYASFNGKDHRKNMFFTATLFPTFVFIIIFLLNLFLVAAQSSGAVPLGTMLFVVFLWFSINAPLTVIGGFFGKRHGGVSHPVRVNQIPRQIPPCPKYLRPWPATLLGGILPFGAALVELYFVLSSIFASRTYYAYGFLGLTAGVFSLTTATATILFTYFLLCAEEYRWHWRSFLIGGGSSLWLIAYGVFYWVKRLSLDSFSSTILYFGYLLLFALLEFLISGAIGFLATYWAIRRLYAAIRVD